MKKYFEPDIWILKLQGNCIMASKEFVAGESLWDNETPLIPFE